MRKLTQKNVIDSYARAVLESPGYTPTRVLIMLEDMYYPEDEDVSANTLCRLLDCDKCTLSRVINKHMVFTPRLILTILDLTGWTLEHFRAMAGMPPIVSKPTREELEDIHGRRGKVVKSLRRENPTANRAKNQHPTAWKDPDSGELGLEQRPPRMESSDWYRGRRPRMDKV